MEGYLFLFFPFLRICGPEPGSRFLISNVLEPKEEKLLLMFPFKLSIAVRIPTNALMPTAMMSAVRLALSKFVLMERNASFIFSKRSMGGESGTKVRKRREAHYLCFHA